MELKELSSEQLAELTQKTEDKEALREIATHVGASFSGNTGVAKLKENILAEIILDETPDETEPEIDEDLNQNDPVAQALIAQNKKIAEEESKDEDVDVKQARQKYSVEEMMEMDAAKVKDDTLRRQVIRTQALRLRHVRTTNNEPADAEVPGAIVSIISPYTGKVAKFIPFEEEVYENGYHVPQILLDDLASRTYSGRRKDKNSKFGVNKYKTVRLRKFNIEYLRDLTPAQLESLAKDQAARNAIDRSNAN